MAKSRARPVYLWGNRAGELSPPLVTLLPRVRRQLGIVRTGPGAYRVVRDPWGNRVLVGLERVMEHIAGSNDPTRWQSVPGIIAAIKHAEHLHYKVDTHGRETYADDGSLTVHRHWDQRGETEPYRFFVYTHPLSPTTPLGQVPRELEFSSVVPARRSGKVRREETRAGAVLRARTNPVPAWAARDAVEQSPARQHLPGARPALQSNASTGQSAQASHSGSLFMIAFGALVALARLAQRPQQEVA
ncbi:MAG: hypothetical protein HY690_09130 [Chloroflexi bacterium]|nr:hypothetical protein [Chloroflexota bacterium]